MGKVDLSPNTMTKLCGDELVVMVVPDKIFIVLHTDYGEIMQYVPEMI